jgi:hypothetical protein
MRIMMKSSLALFLALSVLGARAPGSPKVSPPFAPAPTVSLAARQKPGTRPIIPGNQAAVGLPPKVGGLAK